MSARKTNQTVLTLCVLLAAATVVLYWPALRNGFIYYDDPRYIFENPHVSPGLTWEGFRWSFQCGYAANWHPLTWLSHMLDCTLFGLNPAGHHFVNVLFHAGNTVLVLLLLNTMTGCPWRSAFVAALFACHPLHVESVAWASERKDVLSVFFGLLAMIFYARQHKSHSTINPQPSTLLCFALSLMSKPMLVTLPFVLLLLDVWPLRRIEVLSARRLGPCALEKLPFLALSIICSVLTWKAQVDTMRTWVELPLGTRVANAAVSYFRYLGKTFWPADLSIIYPYQHHWPVGIVSAAAIGLVAITLLVALLLSRAPYLGVGWLWFLGTLVPVIGLVQVGGQAMADRYMYFPSIGLFIALVWAISDAAQLSARLRKLAPALGALAVLTCAMTTAHQLNYWRDGERLFRHALDITPDNYIACECLYKTMESKGDKESAYQFARQAVEIEPQDPLAHYNLGTALIERGRIDEAINQFKIAVQQHPRLAEAENNWGRALLDQGNTQDAETHLTRALNLQPDNPEICYNMGMLLLKQSRPIQAIDRFSKALAVKPDYADSLTQQAFAALNQTQRDEVVARFSRLENSHPGDPQAHLNWGLVLLEQNRPADAEKEFSEAARLNPHDARTQCQLAVALIQQRKAAEAVIHYRAALRLRPLYTGALNGLAWIIATSPDQRLRDGSEALRLARQACDATAYSQPAPLITLAAAAAETGQFEKAKDAIRQAQALAIKSGAKDIEARATRLLNLFASGHTVAQALK